MKTLLIVISTLTLLLFTSCEKDEMGIGEGAGGGMQDTNTIVRSTSSPSNCEEILAPGIILKAEE